MPIDAPEPIVLPAGVWSRPDVLDMCRRRDAGGLLRLANSSKFQISQGRLAYWIDTEPGVVNKMINGKSGDVVRLDKWERIADALNMPDNARMALGLAPRSTLPPSVQEEPVNVETNEQLEPIFASLRDLLVSFRRSAGLTQQQLANRTGYSRSAIAVIETACGPTRTGGQAFWKRCDDELAANGAIYRVFCQLVEARAEKVREQTRREERERQVQADAYRASSGLAPLAHDAGTIDRRSVLRTAAWVGGLAVSSAALFRLSDAISAGSLHAAGFAGNPFPQVERIDGLRRRLDTQWRRYQSGVYRPILAQLPDLLTVLDSLDVGGQHAGNATVLHDLRSRAYQLAASLAYKFGDTTLGLIAAERGIAAAGHAGDPLLGGVALTRLTHGLRNSGHVERAMDLTLRGAAAVEESGSLDDPARASVYGALLLHSSMASARKGDGSTARSLLLEAGGAASRSGEGNHYYTAFGPTNVSVWGVGVLTRLGDSPTALTHASAVTLDLLPVAERKGAFLIDHATAYTNQGGHDATAVELLLSAETIAPDEVYGRPNCRLLVDELLGRSRPTWSGPLRALSHRMSTIAG